MLDSGGYSYPLSSRDCGSQNKVPGFTVLGTVPSETEQFYPYLMTPAADCGTEMCDAVLGMRQMGFFSPDKGFKKLGLLDVVRRINAAGVAVILAEQSLDVAVQAVFLGDGEPPAGGAAPT